MGNTIVNKYDFERDVFFSKFLLLNLGIFGVVRCFQIGKVADPVSICMLVNALLQNPLEAQFEVGSLKCNSTQTFVYS